MRSRLRENKRQRNRVHLCLTAVAICSGVRGCLGPLTLRGMSGETIARLAILVSTATWAWAEVLKIRRPERVKPARRVWTFSLVLMFLHAIVAFDVGYGGSFEVAVAETARQTKAVTGIDWGGGFFLNFLFLAAWLVDAVWWWVTPLAYSRRPAILERGRLAFFVFMFFNGAVLFAGPVARTIGIPAVAAVSTAWCVGRRRRPAHA